MPPRPIPTHLMRLTPLTRPRTTPTSSSSIVLTFFIYQRCIRHKTIKTKSKYSTPGGRNFVAAVNNSSIGKKAWNFYCDAETLKATRRVGFDERSSMSLVFFVLSRLQMGWTHDRMFHVMRYFHDWKRNSESVPAPYRWAGLYYIDDVDYAVSIEDANLDYPDAVAEALLAYADQRLRQSLNIFHINGEVNTPDLAIATAFLDLAVKFGNIGAAVATINISEDPVLWPNMDPKPNLGPARDLVKTQVVQNPSAMSWEAVVTYMRHEYRIENIARQTPNQLKWAINVLLHLTESLEPGRKSSHSWLWIKRVIDQLSESNHAKKASSDTQARWFKCENPWKVLHRLMDHCSGRGTTIADYSTQELEDLRERCLMELARYHDPDAAFTVALRNEQFGTETWENMMKCAAAAGNPDANWLLGIYHLRKDELLNHKNWAGSSDSFKQMILGVDYAVAGLKLSIDRPQPRVYWNRVVALTALWKNLGFEELAGECLQNSIEHMRKSPNMPPQLVRELESFLIDFRKPDQEWNMNWSWHASQCAKYIDSEFDAEATCKLAMRHPAYIAKEARTR